MCTWYIGLWLALAPRQVELIATVILRHLLGTFLEAFPEIVDRMLHTVLNRAISRQLDQVLKSSFVRIKVGDLESLNDLSLLFLVNR